MPVVPMQKIALLGHQKVKEEVISFLQKSAAVELSAPPETSLTAVDPALVELEAALKLLESLSGRKKSFVESFAPFKETVSAELLAETTREFNWPAIISELKALEAELANLRNLEYSLRADMALLEPWRNLELKLDRLTRFSRTSLAVGHCQSKEFSPLQQELARLTEALELAVVKKDKKQVYFLLFYLSAEAEILAPFFHRHKQQLDSLPQIDQTPQEECRRLKVVISEAVQDRVAVAAKLRALTRHQRQLAYVYDHLFLQQLALLARNRAVQTERTFYLTGWLPRPKLAAVKAGLTALTPLVELIEIEPDQGEAPPTLLANPPFLYPFELITRIFGLPSQGEIDPTGPLAFFYLLFFAICLSDVGYGTILTIVAFYYLKTLTLSEGGKKLLLLLCWGGLATIFLGIITGSYFGLDAKLLPPFLRQLQVIDPIKNPLNVLVLSLLLGVVQNLTGIAISFYWKARRGDWVNALLDDGLWIFFLAALVGLVVSLSLGSPIASLFSRLSIGGAAALFLTQGRSEPTILKKAFFGLLSLYRTTGYLGDTLSYSRLLALMMTTSIIGLVINIIADLTRQSVPIFGYALMIIILVVGHLFNLVVSVLGAFIHSTRLQLVEYFGKFYGNGGREFRPFRRETKYVIIKP